MHRQYRRPEVIFHVMSLNMQSLAQVSFSIFQLQFFPNYETYARMISMVHRNTSYNNSL